MEAFAAESAQLVFQGTHKRFFAAIVTTADLIACTITDRQKCDIKTGSVPPEALSFEKVPWLRFRKQVSSGLQIVNTAGHDVRSLGYENEHTVFVVNSAYIVEFLTAFVVDY